MSKEQDLEKQLIELRKSKTFVVDKLDECMRLPDKAKAAMWNSIAPTIKLAVDNQIKTGTKLDHRELAEVVFDKAVKAVLGEDAFSHLEKL